MAEYNVEFHFPYDKVTVERAKEDDLVIFETRMFEGKPFRVRLNDYAGKPIGTYETINPVMVTHMQVSRYNPSF